MDNKISKTVKYWINQFIESLLSEKGYSNKTCRAYLSDIEEFVVFGSDYYKKQNKNSCFGLKKVDTLIIRSYLGYLHKKNKKSTIARKLSALRSFFRYLSKFGVVKNNPIELISTPKQEKKIPKYLTVDDMFRLLDSIQSESLLDIRNIAIFETLYSSGIRVGELNTLNIFNIDFHNNELRVIGKGNKERIVPIGKRALDAISNYRKKSWIVL